MENVVTLGKLIGLLLLFCPPLLSILFLNTDSAHISERVKVTFIITGTKLSELYFTGIFRVLILVIFTIISIENNI